jgi:serine/threonine-protein kinase
MAPEQFLDTGEVDERTDIYSLGCTLYEILSLKRPFPNGLAMERLYELKEDGDFPRVWDQDPGVPKTLGHVVHRCLEPAREDRFQSVTQLQDAVKEAMESRPRPVLPQVRELVQQLGPLNVARLKRELLALLERTDDPIA